MAFCGKCGQQVNEGVRFCPACGSPMQIVAAEPNRQQTPPPVQPFHANQGLLLCIAMFGWIIADSVLTALLRAILWRGLGLWSIYSLCGTVLNLVYIVFTVLAVIGIINALNGRAKELPIIGKYRLLK